MCVVTDESHITLDVPAAVRRDVARALLSAAEAAGLDPADPCHVAALSDGFRVSAVVLAASGLDVESVQAPPGLTDMLAALGDQSRATKAAETVEAPALVEVPAAEAVPAAADESAPARRKRNSK